MAKDERKERGLCELYAEDPERADRVIFGREYHTDRRGFLKGAGLATMAAASAASLPDSARRKSSQLPSRKRVISPSSAISFR